MSRAVQRLAAPLLLGLLPALVLILTLEQEVRDHQIAPDLHYGLYRQAKGLLDSGVGFDPVSTVIDGQNRIYTVLTALVATPLTLVPVGVADVLMTVLLIASAVAIPYLVGVRDPRVYGAAFLWPSLLSGVQTGNLTLLLGLVAALAWRYRSRRFLPGLLVGLAVAAKVFMWPLAIWLIATKRFSAAIAAASVGVASILLMLPFGNPLDYFRVARSNAEVFGKQAYSVYVLLGCSGIARIAWLVLAAFALLAIFLPTDRSTLVGDRSSFTLAITACILCSPIVWIHYFALLLVPLAITRPRFGPLWLAPLIYWLVPFGDPSRWQIVVVLADMGVVAAVLVARPSAPTNAVAEN
jgi:hypothetical protein